ncbi:MAG: FRG domain-containing protein [Bacteroidetes bacterium]|nr:FRG domain-containing protein [Bacteroidota bacterium]
MPSLLFRTQGRSFQEIADLEKMCYYDFRTEGGSLLRPDIGDWELLFEMQHHGVPTRLLDWSESFATALFFAVHKRSSIDPGALRPCIWIADPSRINELSTGDKVIFTPSDLSFTYHKSFVDKSDPPPENPIAMMFPRVNPRMVAQKAFFVLQGRDPHPMNLNATVRNAFVKIEIPMNALDEAEQFLDLAGVDEFTVFPDLDHLAMHIRTRHRIN